MSQDDDGPDRCYGVAGGQGRSGLEILTAGFGIMSIVGFAIAAAAVGGILWLAMTN